MTNNKKKPRGFIFQIFTEIKIVFASKFTIILASLILLGGIAVPIIGTFSPNNRQMERYYGGDMEDLIIKGVTVSVENPQYWEVRELNDNIERLTGRATSISDDLALEFLNLLLDNALVIVPHIESYEDYRSQLSWQRQMVITEKFILEHLDVDKDVLKEAIQYRMYFDPDEMEKKYYSLSQIEVLEEINQYDEDLNKIDDIIVNNNHIKFYEYQIDVQNNNLEENLGNIETFEKDIVENPEKEEMYNEQIEQLKKNNRGIVEIQFPIYEYRIANDIIPGSDDWRDSALNEKANALTNIMYNEKVTEAKFEETDYLKREFKTYAAYLKNWQKELDIQTEKLYVSEQSLKSGKPDMDYVTDGTRKNKVRFLWYSLIIAMFGVVIGGGLIAKEYQSGTIRLLLIRPKTRMKIVLSKLLALLVVCLAMYIVADIFNAITNGIIYGFGDYSFPNYTISSGENGIGFLAFYISKFLTCFISVLFAVATAYFLSIVTRNTALSVAIPLVCFVGALMVVAYVGSNQAFAWLAYTPVPYINLSTYFIRDMNNYSFQPILGFGIPLMLALSAVLIATGVLVSNKRDVTN